MIKKALFLAIFSGAVVSAYADDMLQKLKEPLKVEKIEDISRYKIEKTQTQENAMDILDKQITINVRNVSITYLFSLISDYIKYPIVLRDISYPATVSGGSISQTSPQPSAPTPATGLGTQSQAQAQSEYLTVSYFSTAKPLKYVLDEITGMLDLWWKKENDRIVVYKYERKVFYVSLPYLQKVIDEKSDNLNVKYQREFIKNLDQQIRNVLTDPNSKVSVDEMGNILVSARKSEMSFIEEIVKNINNRFAKEIPLKVKVFLVNDTDFSNIGIGFNFKSGSTTGSLLSSVPNSVFNLSVLTQKLELNISALASAGKLKVIEDNVLYALNGQPIVYSPMAKKRIVSNVNLTYTSVSSGSGGTSITTVPTISVNTEDIESGSNLIIVPYFVRDDAIAIDLYRKQQTIDEIQTQNINLNGASNTIALPSISTKTNVSQTILKKGQTLALFSSAMTLKQMKDSGIPFLKDIPLLGYLFSQKEEKDEKYRLIITITFDEQTESSQ